MKKLLSVLLLLLFATNFVFAFDTSDEINAATAKIFTQVMPMGFGLYGARVANTPILFLERGVWTCGFQF